MAGMMTSQLIWRLTIESIADVLSNVVVSKSSLPGYANSTNFFLCSFFLTMDLTQLLINEKASTPCD
jgi:hypothetical protein